MNNKFFGIFTGLMIFLIGAFLLLVGWGYTAHQQLLRKAEALTADGNFAEALHIYQAAEAHYTKPFWNIPQGLVVALLPQFGFKVRSHHTLRLAEMAFREGERLLAVYGQIQPASLDTPAHNRLESDAPGKPPLEEVMKHFHTAEAQYAQIQAQTKDPYWQFIAKANRARTMVQIFLIQAFLAEKKDPLSLKQSLVQAIKSLQSALNPLYTDQIRASVMEARSLVLLLETLTRFQRRPEVEAEERRKRERLIKDSLTNADLAPLGEILRSSNLQSLSPEAENSMRKFLLNQNSSAAFREQTDRPNRGSRTGLGSADAGSEGKLH
ncbi:hypothetical protein NKDENANG_02114 [Candidatus Entotheonellaceae bacterium PAL068K]